MEAPSEKRTSQSIPAGAVASKPGGGPPGQSPPPYTRVAAVASETPSVIAVSFVGFPAYV